MEKLVKIADYQIRLFESALEAEQTILLKEIAELKKTLEDKEFQLYYNDKLMVDLGIKIGLNGVNNKFKEKPEPYKIDSSSWKKVCYILHTEERLLSAREIIAVIDNLEPELSNLPKELRKKFEINIFAILSNNTKFKKLIRFKVGGGYKYGFKEWLDDDGSLKKEFEDRTDIKN